MVSQRRDCPSHVSDRDPASSSKELLEDYKCEKGFGENILVLNDKLRKRFVTEEHAACVDYPLARHAFSLLLVEGVKRRVNENPGTFTGTVYGTV